MIKITKINKYLFIPYSKDNNYLNYRFFKIYLYFLFKFVLILYFFIFSISKNKLKNRKMPFKFKNNKFKKKILNNNPRLFKLKYKNFIEEIPYYNHTHLTSKKIFWCWLQGQNNVPIISRVCLNSIFRYCKSNEIHIINEKNIDKYVRFPSFIINKYKNKIISKTHFSDLLRLELLIKYGGTWIDSTVLITKYNDIFFNKDLFFFQASKPVFYAGSNWFITAEKESPILKTTRDQLYEYWSKNDKIHDYFIFHFFLKIACEKYDKDYKKIPRYINEKPHLLQIN